MTKRQPKGNPKGGQFAEDRRPTYDLNTTTAPLGVGSEVVVYGLSRAREGIITELPGTVARVRTSDGELTLSTQIVVHKRDFENAWHVVDIEGNIIAGGPHLSKEFVQELAIQKDGMVRQGREIDIQRLPKEPVNPGFGKPYAGVSYDVGGRRVSMWRKDQSVRFYDDDGEQIGPEQSNVAPAVAYAYSQGWREKERSEDETVASYIPASEAKIGSVVLVSDTRCEVIGELEYDAIKDLFGRSMNTLTLRRLDTGEEGTVMFGPAGVVSQLPS